MQQQMGMGDYVEPDSQMIRHGSSVKLTGNMVVDENGDQPDVATIYDDFFVGGKMGPVPV